jgi:hypothetical protein
VVHVFWEKGLFQNEEIWQVFGLTHSAVSRIVKEVKVRIKKDPKFGSGAKKIKSQFKMCPNITGYGDPLDQIMP